MDYFLLDVQALELYSLKETESRDFRNCFLFSHQTASSNPFRGCLWGFRILTNIYGYIQIQNCNLKLFENNAHLWSVLCRIVPLEAVAAFKV